MHGSGLKSDRADAACLPRMGANAMEQVRDPADPLCPKADAACLLRMGAMAAAWAPCGRRLGAVPPLDGPPMGAWRPGGCSLSPLDGACDTESDGKWGVRKRY